MTDQPAIPVICQGDAREGRFYVIDAGFRDDGGAPGVELANEKVLRLPGTYRMPPPNGDPGQYPEAPRLVQVPARGGPPRDIEVLAGTWIVSDALKRVFETVDPEGFAFAACEFVLADGSPGPRYHLCGVRRTLDALDEAASRLRIETGDFVNGKYYDRSGGASLVFRQDIVGAAHVFRTPFAPTVFCDRVLHDAVRAAGVSGVLLVDAADC